MAAERTGRGDPQRTLALLWGRDTPPARGPKPALTVDAIVAAAIAIADAEGIKAVSMRHVATSLGAGTMSLYRHVPGKAELLDLMLDRTVGDVAHVGKGPEGWRAKLELYAQVSREGYHRHPWMLDVSMVRPPLGPNVLAQYEAMLAAVAETGLPPTEWNPTVMLVVSYVNGFARWERQLADAERATGVDEATWWEAHSDSLERFFVEGDHPTITRAYHEGGFDDEFDAFEYGLGRLLDGIALRIGP